MNPVPPPVELVCLATAALGDLGDRVTFLGGAVVGLLVTDPAAPKPKPTKDVDVVIEVATTMDYYRFQDQLLLNGFCNVLGPPICRFEKPPLVLDVMPTSAEVLGFSNRWYAVAVSTAERRLLPNGITINLVTPACFLATKLEAFDSPEREAHGDMLASSDFEDIVAVIDGRPTIADDVLTALPELRNYIIKRFSDFLRQPAFDEGLAANMDPGAAGQARVNEVGRRIASFAAP